MKQLLILLPGLLILLALKVGAEPLKLPAIQVTPIKDSGTGRHYELYIKLPEDYKSSSSKKYPVIYYTDAFWHVELLSAATSFLLEEAILVGISWQKDIDEELKKTDGEHVSRYRDYSIGKSSNQENQAKYQFGQANSHLAFIHNDIFSYIENNYRTDTSQRTYFGYSLGGLFGAYVLVTKPETFKNYILGSPSVRNLSQIKAVASKTHEKLNANVFISYGSNEDELGKHVDAFIAFLNTRNDSGLSITHAIPEGTHQTAFPLTGIHSVKWLSKKIKDENS
jgi:predicted alpha/beta superfamily hydrolase